MLIPLIDWWEIDPLPLPPADFGTVIYWRWWSALTLARRVA